MELTFVLYLRNCGNNLQATLDLLKDQKILILLDESVDLTNKILETNKINTAIIHKQKFNNLANALNYLFINNLIQTDFYQIIDVRNQLDLSILNAENFLNKKTLYFGNLVRYSKTYKPLFFTQLKYENLDFINTIFYTKQMQKLSGINNNEITYFELLNQYLKDGWKPEYIKPLICYNDPELFDMNLRRYQPKHEDQIIEFLNEMIANNHQEYVIHYLENNLEFLKNILKRGVVFNVKRRMHFFKVNNKNYLQRFLLIKKYKSLFKITR
ncbi:hypothetical protein [Mycoplasma sp. E35C]|uniref:hypothetical protein n=1 Tax=Mycoplasma sp. E35C TaxID=2801918 RepID=UPI001CA41B1E|nr:hypothetical protein [Mycoplasma sp. E35C]QZX49213.1 hypothetical protein JJE79_00350 [Mycoplasma sp. E35C]